MFPEGIGNILSSVLSSWQVIAVTVVLILYLFIVNSVSRDSRPGFISKYKLKPPVNKRKKQEAAEAAGPAETGDSGDADKDLGLSEEE